MIEALASEHRVYALDHIYDIGRSIYRKQPRRPGDFVRWLDEVFDELDVHDVRLVGHSYGGWIASLYALEFPERLDKLVLLSAPTVLRPPLGLYARAILYGTFPSRSYIRRYLYWYAPDCVRHEVSYSAERTVRRLAAVAPRVKAEITDGDHHLTITRPDWVIQHVLGFLADR